MPAPIALATARHSHYSMDVEHEYILALQTTEVVSMNATVAERGQVTIPKALRQRLGIGPHTILDFTAENGRLIAVKTTPADPVSKVQGCLKLERPVDDWIADIRGDR